MKSKFYGWAFALAVSSLFFTSCVEEKVTTQYNPIELENVTFDTIPVSSLDYAPLRALGEEGFRDGDKVKALEPKWKFFNEETGDSSTAAPGDYASEEDKRKYREHLAELDLYKESLALYESRGKGVIRISWEYEAPTNPLDSNMYVEVTYFDHKKQKNMRRNGTSLYKDGKYRGYVLVSGTLRSYSFKQDGSLQDNPLYYDFKVQPVSGSLKRGTAIDLNECYSSYFIPYWYTVNPNMVVLTKDNVWLLDKAKKPSELNGDGDKGAFKNLYDNNVETFFHTDYSDNGAKLYPWSIAVDAEFEKENVMIKYNTRHDNANGCPADITIFASNDRDFANEVEVGKMSSTSADLDYKLPLEMKTAFSSGTLSLEKFDVKTYRYFRVQVDKTKGGANFFSLAEFQLGSAKQLLMDPENNPEDRL